MRRKTKSGGIYAYLEQMGVLETGDDVCIKAAKAVYWREYKRAWKQNKRRNTKTITVHLDSQEWQIIGKRAREHKRSGTAYLKGAALAYSSHAFLVPDIQTVLEIKELLVLSYTELQKALNKKLLSYTQADELMQRIATMEIEVYSVLHTSPTIEEKIGEAVRDNPSYKDELLFFLKTM